jgi:hypothetical protein
MSNRLIRLTSDVCTVQKAVLHMTTDKFEHFYIEKTWLKAKTEFPKKRRQSNLNLLGKANF